MLPRAVPRYSGNVTDPGSGNILICGPPGSGKSTLGLQFAVMCARRSENRAISVYVPLENTAEEVKAKADPFGWTRYLRELRHLHSVDEFSSTEDLGEALLHVLTQPHSLLDEPAGQAGPACPIPGEPESTCGPPRDHRPACDRHTRQYDASRAAAGRECRVQECVLMPSLSPRPNLERSDPTAVFWKRYHELETLLIGGLELRRKWDGRDQPLVFPIVVIDSLNMLSSDAINRDQISALFALFRRYETVGVFTVETTQFTPFDSTLADIVITLGATEDNDYFLRYIEIEKSRYRNQVYGRHPFKTLTLKTDASENPKRTPPILSRTLGAQQVDGDPLPSGDIHRHGVVVFPSLHYVVKQTGAEGEEPASETSALPSGQTESIAPAPVIGRPTADGGSKTWSRPGVRWGIRAFNHVLPGNLSTGSVIAIEGPRGTFKTNFAVTFLARGLAIGESALLVRLHDSSLLAGPAVGEMPALSEEVVEGMNLVDESPSAAQEPGERFTWEDLERLPEDEGLTWQNLADPGKAIISGWRNGKGEQDTFLFEIDFRSGALLPEEFVHIIRDIVIRLPHENRIRRVVLDDVSEIGAGYPFLRRSKTSGDMFLAAFAHVMRNHGIDLVVTGTTGGLAAANEAVERICAIADAVVSCQFSNIFGRRHVVVQGEGLVGQMDSGQDVAGGSIPPVVANCRSSVGGGRTVRTFRVDPNYLEGLVGFESGNVYRPGVSVHVFEENELHQTYNRELEVMLSTALACPRTTREPADRQPFPGPEAVALPDPAHPSSDVQVFSFDSELSEAIHDSLRVLPAGSPLDKTVLCTVDEFWQGNPKTEDAFLPLNSQRLRKIKWEISLRPDKRRTPNIGTGQPLTSADQEQSVYPYYLNALLLAHRIKPPATEDEREGGPSRGPCSPASDCRPANWSEVESLAEDIFARRDACQPPIRRTFFYDHTASETLSCLLMDGLVVGHAGETGQDINTVKLEDVLFSEQPRDLNDKQVEELSALCRLLQSTREQSNNRAGEYESQGGGQEERQADAKKQGEGAAKEGQPSHRQRYPLPPDAGVYVCWYSQLRDLITREPDLSEQLRICPLPGRGFTGHWFIGVVKGSVSPELGKAAIERLCRKEEEYKRFSRGVGLPARKAFYDEDFDFFAWPRGCDVKLQRFRELLELAHSRSAIRGYERIRSTLSTVASQLTDMTGPAIPTNDNARVAQMVRQVVGRLFRQIKMLRDED